MEAPPLTAAERIAHLIEHLETTPYTFAKECGLSHQTISNVLTEKNKPGFATLEAIARRYPQAAAWLLTGTGQLLRNAHAATPTEERPQPDPPADEAQMPASLPRKNILPVAGDAEAESEGGRTVDITGRYIRLLERQVVYLEQKVERLEKPLPAPDAAWLPLPRPEISLRPTACTVEPEARQGGKVIQLWAAQAEEEAAAA